MQTISYKKLECKPGVYLDDRNRLTIHLYKSGNFVSCSVECAAALTLGTITINEISIPVGYRPIVRQTIPYINIDSGTALVNGGEWIIESTGEILGIISNTSYIERYTSMSWITED